MTRDERHRRALELQFPEGKRRQLQNAVSKPEYSTVRRYTRGSSGQLTHQLFTAVRVMVIPNAWEATKEVSSKVLKY